MICTYKDQMQTIRYGVVPFMVITGGIVILLMLEPHLSASIIIMALAIVMMFVLNWKLALCVMVIVPVLVLSGAYFQKKLVFFHRRVREQNSKISGAFNEGITGAKTTKTLVIEDKVEQEFDDLTGEMKRLSVRAMHFRGVFMSTTAFAASIALADRKSVV